MERYLFIYLFIDFTTLQQMIKSTNLCNFGAEIAFLEEFDQAYNACRSISGKESNTLPIMQAQSRAHNYRFLFLFSLKLSHIEKGKANGAYSRAK